MDARMKPGFEVIDPKFKTYIMGNAPLEKLAEGFRWTEGPVWFGDMQELLFSDIPNDRIMRWTESGLTVFRQPADYSNGQTRDLQGRLITCSHGGRSLTRTEYDGTITTLADRYQGKLLNSPNDVVVKSDGTIWFTDPPYGINTDYEGGRRVSELAAAVYRYDPRDKSLVIVADDFDGPNGLCFSPDEKKLYIVETGHQFVEDAKQSIRVFDVTEGSSGSALSKGKKFHSIQPGNADGIRCDEHGNIWSSAGDGVHCIDAEGKLLGKIFVPATVANITFGGKHRSRLFICATDALYAIYLNVRGVQKP